ncbi:hypothetical protein F511_41813 [Dorcoceras hygrometricum]|uniref:C2H2-type domain-containing protein n=1 Tax=Dorcoceras hygrometricum TaxID=472368 RepID=A0A2Z7D685_9LAMI|nr:hypothetical protein F511_41813 [Dorcoceras hygrometricum]
MSSDVFSVPICSTKAFPQDLEQNPNPKSSSNNVPCSAKKRRNLPGTPDPDAEVIALSPGTLMAKNRFICEICNKGFQRDQNLQLHRRGHNLPWKLKQRANKDQIKKKVYICPEKTCVHHDPARALGDLTGVKKHYSRKHGEKKWKCEKCSKKYAVQSDWKAHSKTCGTREYKCDCGTLFSRRDSFITHRAFCDALAEESARNITTMGANNMHFRNEHALNGNLMNLQANNNPHLGSGFGGGDPILWGDVNSNTHNKSRLPLWLDHKRNTSTPNSSLFIPPNSSPFPEMMQMGSNNLFGYGNLSLSPPPSQSSLKEETFFSKGNAHTNTNTTIYTDSVSSQLYSSETQIHHTAPKCSNSAPMSATALLQKAAQIGSTKSNNTFFGNTAGVLMSTSSPSSSSTNALSFSNPFAESRSELDQVFGKRPDIAGRLHGVADQNGPTRDFLGVGRGSRGDPFFSPELAKFVSMNSPGGLSHFTGKSIDEL